jgi:hypothetical protein
MYVLLPFFLFLRKCFFFEAGHILTDEEKHNLFGRVSASVVRVLVTEKDPANGHNIKAELTAFVVRNFSNGEHILLTTNHGLNCHSATNATVYLVFFNRTEYFPPPERYATDPLLKQTFPYEEYRASVLAYGEKEDFCFLRFPSRVVHPHPLLPTYNIYTGMVILVYFLSFFIFIIIIIYLIYFLVLTSSFRRCLRLGFQLSAVRCWPPRVSFPKQALQCIV